ncbi:MAG: PadR family transcriptional regulator [Desulfovibrionales bacterium]
MDTKTLCLGALTRGDASGYEIKKMVEESFGHFLAVSYGSIYPALADLNKEGLIDCTLINQDSKPDKKVYRLNEAGKQRLQENLMACRTDHKVRSEFLFALCFAHLMTPERIQDIIAGQSEEFEKRIANTRTWMNNEELPRGMRFAAGFGNAVMSAALKYIHENQEFIMLNGDEK